jgi:hypothetical protein
MIVGFISLIWVAFLADWIKQLEKRIKELEDKLNDSQ